MVGASRARPLKWALVVLTTAAATLAVTTTARAASKQLWYHERVDQIASDIAGVGLRVDGEDDWGEWAYLTYPADPNAVMGFVAIHAPSTSFLYHRVFISPRYWTPLVNAAVNGPAASGADPYTTAKAIFDVTHEAYHYRLFSDDEGRVNACALQAFPDVVSKEFGLAATTTRTETHTVRVKVAYRAKVHDRWVTRYRWKTTYQQVTTTVPNPLYSELVADAEDFYRNQPPPYNTGTCS